MRAEVTDSFDVKGRVAVEYGATGVVVIFTPDDLNDPPVPGDRVLLVKPDGWIRSCAIGEVKLTPGAPGFFLAGLSKGEVPVGTRVSWGKDVSSAFMDSVVLASAG